MTAMLVPGRRDRARVAAEAFRNGTEPAAVARAQAEAWKYTSLRSFREAARIAGPAVAEPLDTSPEWSEARIIVANGRLFDQGDLPDAVSVAEMGTPAAEWANAQFDRLADPEAEPMAALNASGAHAPIAIRVAAGEPVRLQLSTLAAGSPEGLPTLLPRVLLLVDPGAHAVLLQTDIGQGSYWNNPLTEIVLGEGAKLFHVRLQEHSGAATETATTYVEVAKGAEYDSFLLAVGAKLARHEVHLALTGTGATCHLNAAQLLDGTRHLDTTTVITHRAPGCASRQTVKTVASGRSRGVFQGRIHVLREAQKTDGYQMNQSLLLSETAEVLAKPQLEIYADDVKCSHGATVGALDPEQLFYLRSRGVPLAEAKAMLVHAFLEDALTLVGDVAAREALLGAVDAWWERQAEAAA